MLDVFETDDGYFHQATLSLNRLTLVRLVVERLAFTSERPAYWEWIVWPAAELADGDATPLSGSEPSLAAAKRQAFDASISILADLTKDCATEPLRLMHMRPMAQLGAVRLSRPQ